MIASMSENPYRAARTDRLRAAADADPDREGPGLQMRHDVLVREGSPGRPVPGDRPTLQQCGEELRLLLEQPLVVGQVVAEERERLGARATPEDDLRPSTGQSMQGGVALEHADRIVRAEDGDGRTEMDARRARRDRSQDHVAGRHGPVVGVMLADAEEVDADLVGEHALLDDAADRLSVSKGMTVFVGDAVPERVEAEGEGEVHGCSTGRWCCHVGVCFHGLDSSGAGTDLCWSGTVRRFKRPAR